MKSLLPKNSKKHRSGMVKISILLLSITSVVFSSCTVHKRVHRKGWYVSWNHSSTSSDSKKNVEQNENNTDPIELKDEQIYHPSSNSTVLKTNETTPLLDSQQPVLSDIPENQSLSHKSAQQEDEIILDDDYPTPSTFAPIIMGFGTGAFLFVGFTAGWISILVPIGISVLIALIAWLGMRYQIKKGNGMKYNKNFLWWMFSCIAAAFVLHLLFFGGALALTPITFLGIGTLVLLSGAFLGKIKKDQQNESNSESFGKTEKN